MLALNESKDVRERHANSSEAKQQQFVLTDVNGREDQLNMHRYEIEVHVLYAFVRLDT